MGNIFQLRKRYHEIINTSFNTQDRFTVTKAVKRSKRVLPRGRVYHRLVMLEVNSQQK